MEGGAAVVAAVVVVLAVGGDGVVDDWPAVVETVVVDTVGAAVVVVDVVWIAPPIPSTNARAGHELYAAQNWLRGGHVTDPLKPDGPTMTCPSVLQVIHATFVSALVEPTLNCTLPVVGSHLDAKHRVARGCGSDRPVTMVEATKQRDSGLKMSPRMASLPVGMRASEGTVQASSIPSEAGGIVVPPTIVVVVVVVVDVVVVVVVVVEVLVLEGAGGPGGGAAAEVDVVVAGMVLGRLSKKEKTLTFTTRHDDTTSPVQRPRPE